LGSVQGKVATSAARVASEQQNTTSSVRSCSRSGPRWKATFSGRCVSGITRVEMSWIVLASRAATPPDCFTEV